MTEQFIYISSTGSKSYFKDKDMTIFHREDGPAVEYSNGYKAWYLNGVRHREGGPAIEFVNGTKAWWLNGELHRADGPAVEYCGGTKEWHLYGLLHRTDGPAYEGSNGTKEWWVNGKELTEAEFNAQYGPKPSCEGKVVEVEGVKYKLVKA